jgi:hypothetical protein
MRWLRHARNIWPETIPANQIVVNDDRVPLEPGDTPRMKLVRFFCRPSRGGWKANREYSIAASWCGWLQ